MQSGDIVVVQLDAGLRFARYIETKSNRVRVAIGRNREARLPASRVVHQTGLSASGYDAVESLSHQSETVAESIDLEEVWDVVTDDGTALTLDDIGELYWGVVPSVHQTVGLLLNLMRDDLRFARDGEHFLARNRELVARTVESRLRQAQRTADAEELAAAIHARQLPDSPTEHQADILAQVRGFVLHGDDYSQASFVKRFLEGAGVTGRDLQRGAFESLVALGQMDADEHLALERGQIEQGFTDEVLAEAQEVDGTALLDDPTRTDLTELTVLSIDDENTRDRDDALSVERTDGGAYRVGVHITDAGALIPRDSALDAEADRRMSSLYLPEQTISMLPPAVSTDIGSLSPSEPRAAVTVFVELTTDGEVTDWNVVQSVVRNRHALSYEESDRWIGDESHPLHTELTALHRVAKALRAAREAKGALNLDRDELSVKVDAAGQIEVSVTPRSAPSRSLVQEYMVLCNSLLARYCSDNEIPAPFRSQVVPDIADIRAQIPEGPLRWYMMSRRLSPASVSTKAACHGGLGVEAYTQATSPLRRYADLVVQRQISHHLRTGQTLYDENAVTSIAHRADMQVRQLSRIENNRRSYFFLKWLDERTRSPGATGAESHHNAVVLENRDNRTAVVELVDWPFRSRAALPNSIKPGQVVPLVLHGVDLWRRTAQFTLEVSGGRD